MLTETDIQKALHAQRVVALSVPNPHGPLGLEQLAAAVGQIPDSPVEHSGAGRIRCPISLTVQAWEKLEELARTTGQKRARSLTAAEVAAAIIEQFVATSRAG
jgi:hypothetical protein